jgi:hypothetical protein
LITGEQLRRERHRGLGPGGHMRAPAALPLVEVVGHPTLLAAIGLHIGDVQVNRHLASIRRGSPTAVVEHNPSTKLGS